MRDADGREAVLTLYANGSEPDPEVYDALRTLDRDHVPEILETGRWEDRAYEVSEGLRGGTLADLGLLADDIPSLSAILREVGGALAVFAECGLRHRDLRPGAIMVRARDPRALGAALHREGGLRPVRERLSVAVVEAGESAGALPPKRIPELLEVARLHLGQLAAAEALVARLEAYPESPVAYAMARAASRQAVEGMIEGIDQGLARHAARTASLAALTRLSPWMSDGWNEARGDAVRRDGSNTTAVGPVEAEAPHIAAYQRFRARVAQVGEAAMAAFSELARIRERLEALDEASLEVTVRRIGEAMFAHRRRTRRAREAPAGAGLGRSPGRGPRGPQRPRLRGDRGDADDLGGGRKAGRAQREPSGLRRGG